MTSDTGTNGNGNGMTVKELITDLTTKLDAYAATAAALKVDVAVHAAGDGHPGLAVSLKEVSNKIDGIAISMAERKGERAGNDRTWKVIASLMSLPGIGALVAILTGNTPGN